MKRVLFLTKNDFSRLNYGPSFFTYGVLKSLTTMFNVHCVHLGTEKISKIPFENIEYEFVQEKKTNALRCLLGFNDLSCIKTLIRKNINKYDFVILDMYYFHSLIHLIPRKKVCVLGHDMYSLMHERISKSCDSIKLKIKHKIYSWLFGVVESKYKNISQLILVSEVDALYYKDKFKKDNYAVVPIFVPDEYFNYSDCNDLPNILISGRFESNWMQADAKKLVECTINNPLNGDVYVLGKNSIFLKSLNCTGTVYCLDWVESFSDFLIKKNWVVLYVQKNGTGLQTKIQQMLASGNYVIAYEPLNSIIPVHQNANNSFTNYKDAICKVNKQMKQWDLHDANVMAQETINLYSIEKIINEYNVIFKRII